jgi:hypothetical protein
VSSSAFNASSQQRAWLADIVERTPVRLALKRGARITTTLTTLMENS